MGYWETEGIVLRRQDRFETDQFVQFLTSSRGVLSVRVPHGQKSQKTHCGRLEPPNLIRARLYQSREDGPWTLSESSISTVYADLMGEEQVKLELWPLLSLFNDLFPEGESPGQAYARFEKALRYLKRGFRPAVLISTRLLAMTARDVGIALDVSGCRDCGRDRSSEWLVHPEKGLLCDECAPGEHNNQVIDEDTRQLFYHLFSDEWDELTARKINTRALGDLESILYRLFHYHFEISLDTLEVRRAL